jgi:hypothetical protein
VSNSTRSGAGDEGVDAEGRAFLNRLVGAGRMPGVSWVFVGLLACAVVVLVAAEWPRLARKTGLGTRKERERARRKASWRVVSNEGDDTDDFAASVQRDLAQLPTIDDRE